MANYAIGLNDPYIPTDEGIGQWNSKVPDAQTLLKYGALAQLLDINPVFPAVGLLNPLTYGSKKLLEELYGKDAVKHLQHYFLNSGETYSIDLDGMIRSVPDAQNNFQTELSEAVSFVEKLKGGTFQITSRVVRNASNYNVDNLNSKRNWSLAMGDYRYWGKGLAVITEKPTGERDYILNFQYKTSDRYNWNKPNGTSSGTKIKLPDLNIEITDSAMGEFHLCGLAREYTLIGNVLRIVRWNSRSCPNLRY